LRCRLGKAKDESRTGVALLLDLVAETGLAPLVLVDLVPGLGHGEPIRLSIDAIGDINEELGHSHCVIEISNDDADPSLLGSDHTH
jgi:hypothetical protein